MPTLSVTHLAKSFNGRKILDDINLVVTSDEIVTITGKSGAGKTTLLLCIVGFIVPERGSISLDGEEITVTPIEDRQIAYVPQDYGLFPHLTVGDNIAFGLAVRRVPALERRRIMTELLERVELPGELRDRGIEELSGGEKQRVALARALAIRPKLFLFDEPLSAIDPETRETVARTLRSIIKQLSLPAILITHDPIDAERLGDTSYELRDGTLRRRQW